MEYEITVMVYNYLTVAAWSIAPVHEMKREP